MTTQDFLAEQFETHRSRLYAVSLRVLGSTAEAEDAVQETWLRLARTDVAEVVNLGGWLTTVCARICLDHLRSRTSRREAELPDEPELIVSEWTPEEDAVLSDSVGVAMMVVLDTLAPAERLAFVLHDMFAVPFDEIAGMLGRTSTATRQLASRGRRRVQATEVVPEADRARQREVVSAFLAAAREGDFEALVGLLHPEAVIRADEGTVALGAAAEIVGAQAVATRFSGGAKSARLTLLDGYTGLVWSVRGQPQVVFGFTLEEGRIVEIEMLGDPDVLPTLDLAATPQLPKTSS
jgi:RNA polymerase sigma factor (sigma-70 family)